MKYTIVDSYTKEILLDNVEYFRFETFLLMNRGLHIIYSEIVGIDFPVEGRFYVSNLKN